MSNCLADAYRSLDLDDLNFECENVARHYHSSELGRVNAAEEAYLALVLVQ